MSSSSESSSAPSASPPGSPEASVHHEPPGLERLVVHFVSAKRSLTSISHVFRANELVTSSRGLIEEVAVLSARNSFARGGVDEQLDTLHAIRDAVGDVGEEAAAECGETIAALDEAHARLEETLDALRKTVVDASLQRRGSTEMQREDEQEADDDARSSETSSQQQKTLYKFINEATHKDILSDLRALVDSFGQAQSTLGTDLLTFDDALRNISDVLAEGSVTASGPQDKRTIYDEPAPTIPQLFRGMEDHAAEMAKLLESLVNHYDLCVTALKHTEGGGEAAKMAVQAEHLSAKNSAGAEESLYRKTAPEPISEGERVQMLRIVEADGQEVEDVMADIKDHAAEIEGMYEQLTRHALTARSNNKSLRSALGLLHEIKAALPHHISASKVFRESWIEIHASIASKTEDLAGLTNFYEDFLASYANVLREVDRRKTAETQMRKLASKAQKELDKLYEADRVAREDFMDDVRHCLPRDIWPGAEEAGVRWEVGRMDGKCV